MAVKTYILECDNCGFEESGEDWPDDYHNDEEATDRGWWFIKGPDRELGGHGERVYCSRSCLDEGLPA